MRTVVVQRRSGKRHLAHEDGLATRCGRILHRRAWAPAAPGEEPDCRVCRSRDPQAARAATENAPRT